MADEFDSLNIKTFSDCPQTYSLCIAWLTSIRGYSWNGIDKPEINFPVIADIKMDVAKIWYVTRRV